MPLTGKQAAFVREYLIDLNATKAATRAGYSERTAYRIGHENLRKRQIADAIAAAQAQLSEHALVTAQDVVKGLRDEATLYGEGASHSARVAAWAHLGKYLGLFTDKSEVTIKRDPREMSTDELEEYLRARGLLE